jgi:uncharacterized protein DUF4852
MRFTRLFALSLTFAVSGALYAQNPKRPQPRSRTIAPPQTPRSSSPLSALPPQMSPEKAFYYFVAMYGFGKILRYGEPDDAIQIYGESFDAGNYARAMADEFERKRYKEQVRTKIMDGVKKVDFNEKFTFVASATLGEYSFADHSFPLQLLQEYHFCIGPSSVIDYTGCELIAVTGFRAKDAVNGKDFNFSLPTSETDASAFIKSRSNGTGKVDRSIALVITYSVVSKRWQQPGVEPGEYSRPIFSPFIYSIEAYTNKALTAKLGIVPKINSAGAGTAEELRLATIAAQAATKEFGKYRNMIEYREKSSGGRILDPLRPMPSRPQLFGTITLTDVGISLLEEQPNDVPTKKQLNFFNSPTAILWRENDSEYWDPNAQQVARKYGVDKDIYSVHWQKRSGGNYDSFRFDNKAERDRFFVDLSRAFQEWKTRYAAFQFSAGELSIEQRCEVGQRFVTCP